MLFLAILILLPILLYVSLFLIKKYKKLLKKNVYQEVEHFLKEGDFLHASLILQEYLIKNPTDTKSHFMLIDIYNKTGNIENESKYIEKVIKLGRFNKKYTESNLYKRIASLEEILNNKEKSFGYYLDYLESNPNDQDILLKMAMIAFNEKNFKIANFFFNHIDSIFRIQNTKVIFAKAIVSLVEKDIFENDIFNKLYESEPSNPTFLIFFLLSCSNKKEYNKAIELGEKFLDTENDNNTDETDRYVIIQIIMLQYYIIGNFFYSKIYARTCLETTKLNKWEKYFTHNYLCLILLCLKCEEIKEANELLIKLESLEPKNKEVKQLADYTFHINEKNDEYNIDEKLDSILNHLFTKEYLYEISKLNLNKTFDIDQIIKKRGGISFSYNKSKGKRAFSEFINLDENHFKTICRKIIHLKDYKIENEIPNQGYGEADFISFIQANEKKIKVLFQFKKWINAIISEKYLLKILNRITNLKVEKCFLIGDGILNKEAKKILNQNKDKIEIVNGDDLRKILLKLI